MRRESDGYRPRSRRESEGYYRRPSRNDYDDYDDYRPRSRRESDGYRPRSRGYSEEYAPRIRKESGRPRSRRDSGRQKQRLREKRGYHMFTGLDRFLLILSGLFLAFSFVVWFGTFLNAFGAAYFSLLSFACTLGYVRNKDKGLSEFRAAGFFRFVCFVTFIFMICAFGARMVSLPPNQPERALQPIFQVVLLFLFPLFASIFTTNTDKTTRTRRYSSNYDKEVRPAVHYQEFNTSPREFNFKDCSHQTCLCILPLLIIVSSLFIILTVNYDKKFETGKNIDKNNEAEFKIPIYEGAETKVNVRCRGLEAKREFGQDTPTIIFFHKTGGQGLDFAWGLEILEQDTLICVIDRVGSGKSRNFKNVNLSKRRVDVVADEYIHVLEQMAFVEELEGLYDPENVLFVSHGDGEYYLRAVLVKDPDACEGMVFVDPPLAESTDEFFGLDNAGFNLPDNEITEFFASIFRSDQFRATLQALADVPENCEYVKENAPEGGYDVPVEVIYAENGRLKNRENLDSDIESLGSGSVTKMLIDRADDQLVIFKDTFARTVCSEIMNMAGTVEETVRNRRLQG
eukprot:snap_masked-scaffold_11-processed-gene-12.28-mRNA-1 protein AED:0.79 eAED:1.00 QI:0/0/0/0.5/1/1/2/0/570